MRLTPVGDGLSRLRYSHPMPEAYTFTMPRQYAKDFHVDVFDCFQYAFATIAGFVTIAQFDAIGCTLDRAALLTITTDLVHPANAINLILGTNESMS